MLATSLAVRQHALNARLKKLVSRGRSASVKKSLRTNGGKGTFLVMNRYIGVPSPPSQLVALCRHAQHMRCLRFIMRYRRDECEE